MTGPAWELIGVTVRRGGRAILDDVDLRVRRSTLLAVVGPNGAGKSTLLACLAGDIEPDEGRIRLHGEPLAGHRLADLARHRAVLPQEHRVSFPFRVREVVAMGRAPWRGRPEEDDDERVVAQAMADVEVEHLSDRSFGSLSGGEKARTALGRVLAQSCRLLLLDEPTAALDVAHQEVVMSQAYDATRDGDTVIVVLHDLTLAAAYADSMILLDRGRIRARGRPAEVLRPDLLAEVYEHAVDVFPHPATGAPVVLPRRSPAKEPA